MDLYTGVMTPAEIAQGLINQLRVTGRQEPAAFHQWVEENQGYRVLTLEDQSRWVLRHGEEPDRSIHVHPGRWSPQTRRIRANVLKTAVMVLVHAGVHGENPLDVDLINRVRQQHLGLSPMARLADSGGLGAVIDLLR